MKRVASLGGRLLAGLMVLALGAAPSAGRQWHNGICLFGLADVAGGPRFADHRVARRTIARTAAPILATAEARLFRTMLREGAASGPNFAGAFTIARWGCGSACVSWAVIDARSGRVTFPPRLGTVSGVHVEGPERLIFRRDSGLLVVLGAPEEDEAREGALFLLWTGTGFRRLRFAPARELCGEAPAR